MCRILFVCWGNICRSPMAEFVMKKLCEDRGVQHLFKIESAAVSDFGLGCKVYPCAQEQLSYHGLDCSEKRSRQVNQSDYEKFDYILAMDFQNFKDLNKKFYDDPKHKIALFLEDREVLDPWYTGDFVKTYQDIEYGCQMWIDKLYSSIV